MTKVLINRHDTNELFWDYDIDELLELGDNPNKTSKGQEGDFKSIVTSFKNLYLPYLSQYKCDVCLLRVNSNDQLAYNKKRMELLKQHEGFNSLESRYKWLFTFINKVFDITIANTYKKFMNAMFNLKGNNDNKSPIISSFINYFIKHKLDNIINSNEDVRFLVESFYTNTDDEYFDEKMLTNINNGVKFFALASNVFDDSENKINLNLLQDDQIINELGSEHMVDMNNPNDEKISKNSILKSWKYILNEINLCALERVNIYLNYSHDEYLQTLLSNEFDLWLVGGSNVFSSKKEVRVEHFLIDENNFDVDRHFDELIIDKNVSYLGLVEDKNEYGCLIEQELLRFNRYYKLSTGL